MVESENISHYDSHLIIESGPGYTITRIDAEILVAEAENAHIAPTSPQKKALKSPPTKEGELG